MYNKRIKRGLFLITVTGTIFLSGEKVLAVDKAGDVLELPEAGIESVLKDYYTSNAPLKIEKYLAPSEKTLYTDMAFTNVDEGSYLFVRNIPSTDGEWAGKLYNNYAAKITGPIGEWTKIESGTVSGYVKTEFILTGEAAKQRAQEIVGQAKGSEAESKFSYAESRVEEEARLAVEEQKRIEDAAAAQAAATAEAQAQAEAAAIAGGNGQAVVSYANQFIGNPYVWGGTSLTGGADCSGFIQSVYANFGVSMPRTSGEMRNAGVGVSYEEAQPGDVICYDGHVGIYIGNHQIVNAIDEAHGIGISNATFTSIITVRRLI